MRSLVNFPLAFSALWSWLASLWIFFNIGGTRVTESIDATGRTQTAVEQLTWFQTQGWWGVIILLIFMMLYTSPLYFYRRQRSFLAILFALACIGLTLLAGLSIGPFYLPAAAVLMVGILLHLVVGNVPKRLRNQ
jgi:hypothetical protein